MITIPKLYQENPHLCLHKIKIEKSLEMSLTPENPFHDLDCINCKEEFMSGVYCIHYINYNHLEYFKTLSIRNRT